MFAFDCFHMKVRSCINDKRDVCRNMNREEAIQRVEQQQQWDLLVIGGGSTGLGIAVDAATRGLSTLLVEQADFSKGTSSRSTKLVHGGVRYLAQGDVRLVWEALRERGLFLKNAPHVSRKQPFIIPVYSTWDRIKYWAGLSLYDVMAGKERIGRSRWLSKEEVLEELPQVSRTGLKGGVLYYDGQFDDARMALALAETCVDHGGNVLNYCEVVRLLKNDEGRISGAVLKDKETGILYPVKARVVINATGVFVDEIHEMDSGMLTQTIKPSQGVHLVLPSRFLGTLKSALMIPKTDDGRVLFLVPWHRHLIVGTTDTPIEAHILEPRAREEEIDFILRNARKYLKSNPHRSDILSVFAGLRPLAVPGGSEGGSTKNISRRHHIEVSPDGLLTITGGKWTTYRQMAEDTVDEAIRMGNLSAKPCQTRHLKIHGWMKRLETEDNNGLDVYGTDRIKIDELTLENNGNAERLDESWPQTKGEVVWAVRKEMARKVEDVLCRRFRILFLDKQAAIRMAPKVAEIMKEELHRDQDWVKKELKEFYELAEGY